MGQPGWITFVAVLLTLASSAFATNDSQAAETPHFSENPAVLYKTASEVSLPTGEDVVILREEQSYVFEADGRATSTHYLLLKVATQKGAEEWAVLGTAAGVSLIN